LHPGGRHRRLGRHLGKRRRGAARGRRHRRLRLYHPRRAVRRRSRARYRLASQGTGDHRFDPADRGGARRTQHPRALDRDPDGRGDRPDRGRRVGVEPVRLAAVQSRCTWMRRRIERTHSPRVNLSQRAGCGWQLPLRCANPPNLQSLRTGKFWRPTRQMYIRVGQVIRFQQVKMLRPNCVKMGRHFLGVPSFACARVRNHSRNGGYGMSLTEFRDRPQQGEALDVVERLAAQSGWAFERASPDEITIVVGGKWTDYQLSFTWMDNIEAMHLACAFDLKVPERRRAEVVDLVAKVNEQLWVGHFDLWDADGLVMYRHALVLTGGSAPSHKQCEALLGIA